jgi:tetratricopeptide (TPR) repeat protein
VHLDEDTLAAFVLQTLAEAAREQALHHLDECRSCRSTVATLAKLSLIPAAAAGAEVAVLPPDLPQVGKYRLIRLLGAGAMGIVYEAEDPDLHRRVALKVLRAGAGDLRDEARLLARLAHPNVVAVFEVDTCDGADYVVMELVVGQTLAAWRVERPRGWREIARAIAHAGRGLAAAHAAGIVHRDIKPSNLLVGDDGRVRVTDFGLATAAIGGDRVEVAGTPRYMAPEVAAGETSPASDQYSLGITLDEALPPDAPGWLRGVARRATARDPSQRFPDVAAFAAELERDRGVRMRRIAAIVAAAGIAAGGFAIARAIGAPGSPTCAIDRPLPWSPITLATGFAASGRPHAGTTYALASAALFDYQHRWIGERTASCTATRIEHVQSEQAYDARTRCEDLLQAQLTTRVAILAEAAPETVDHAVELVTSLPPPESCASTGDVRARSTLELALEAQVSAARARFEAGQPGPALEAARRLGAAVDAAGSPALAGEHRLLLGELLAQADGTQAGARGAEATLRDGLVFAARGGDDRLAARIWIALLTAVGSAQGRSSDALGLESFARAALARAPGDPLLEASLDFAAAVLRYAPQRWTEAEALLARSLELRRQALGEGAPLVGKTEGALCTTWTAAGDPTGAMPHCRRALEILSVALGEDHPEVAVARIGLAQALSGTGDPAGARRLLESAAASLQRTYGPTHALVAKVLNNLGALAERLGDTAGAVAAFRRVVDIRRHIYGDDDVRTAAAESNLAGQLIESERVDDARRLLEHALDVQRRVLGERDPEVAGTLSNLAETRIASHDLAGARRDLELAIAIDERALGDRHRDLAVPLALLARVAIAEGHPQQATAAFDRALALPGIDPTLAGDLRSERAGVLAKP